MVYSCSPEDLAGTTLADYREVVIKVRLSHAEQDRYDTLIRQRNDFLRLNSIKLGSLDGWKQFIMASGSPQGRAAMLAHREARSLAYGTEGQAARPGGDPGQSPERAHADLHRRQCHGVPDQPRIPDSRASPTRRRRKSGTASSNASGTARTASW